MNNLEIKEREEKLNILYSLKNILNECQQKKNIDNITYKRLIAGIEYLISEYHYQTAAGRNRQIKMNYELNEEIVKQAKTATIDEKDILVQSCLDLEAKIIMEFVKKYLFVDNNEISPEDIVELLVQQTLVDKQIKQMIDL